ncbi:MAG: multicopper oxidase domain-containing protein, partial [Spirochaetota bacterium]
MKTLLAGLTLLLTLAACNAGLTHATRPLTIPPLIDSRDQQSGIDLELRRTRHEFYPGIASETMGINGSYLGPTIRLHRGANALLRFRNAIGEETTIHGHGLHVAGPIDGGPQVGIAPETTWEIDIPVRQEAGTSWYHPHLMGKTAPHVHAGLAGLYLIEDENSRSLGLPREYGVDDIPLIVQDRSFVAGKMQSYAVTQEQMQEGLRGATLVTNGTISPYQVVPQGWVRLRLVAASNARFFRFYLSNQGSFYKIATEGGFLNEPVPLKELTMGPGERNELLIDLSDGRSVHLMAEMLAADWGESWFWERWQNPRASVVELRPDSKLTAKGTLPARLNNIKFYTNEDAT